MDRAAAFEKLVDELEKAGLAHGPAFLGAAVIKRLDLLLDKTEELLKSCENRRFTKFRHSAAN